MMIMANQITTNRLDLVRDFSHAALSITPMSPSSRIHIVDSLPKL